MSQNALVIYRSSAGSGKTYMLVMEYLNLVLHKPSLYKSILAITFTNKASGEMKERIIDALVVLSFNNDQGSSDRFISAVAEHTGLTPMVLVERARRVLDLILHDYSRFGVSTIDSFFARIVRSLARELHLPLRFNLELDTDFVTAEIVDRLLNSLNEKAELRHWLTEYILDKLRNDGSWELERDITGMTGQLFTDEYRALFPEGNHPPDRQLINDLTLMVSDFETKMAGLSSRFARLLQEYALEVSNFAYKATGPAGFLIKIGRQIEPKEYLPGTRFTDAVVIPENWTTKSAERKDEILSLAPTHFMPLANEVMEVIRNEYPKYLAGICVLKTAYMAGIYGALDEHLIDYRKENETLLISDNNILLAKAISGQDAPFIYEKFGNRFTHYMLDEFQDTSAFQWSNLKPLIINSLGSGNYTMVVGDAKQSIYRWRGGNMNLLQREIQDHLGNFSSVTRNLQLDANFRSREIIVNFNNRFFELAPGALHLPPENSDRTSSYRAESVKQEWRRGNRGEGYVQIRFFEDQKEQLDKNTGEFEEAIRWKTQACEETMAAIQHLLANGFCYSDIAILVRKNQDAKEITEYLIRNGITRILSPESMQLYHSSGVQWIVSAFNYIEHPDDAPSLAALLTHYYLQQHPGADRLPGNLLSGGISTMLDQLPDDFRNRLAQFRQIPLYELAEELIMLFNLDRKCDAYLQRFLDTILTYSASEPASLAGFMSWWKLNLEKDSCSVVVSTGENAISVMTIHKSKGLQFPVVIMPFCDWELKMKPNQILWVKSEESPFNGRNAHPVFCHAELENSLFQEYYKNELEQSYVDNLNLLYVAFTRAEEQLYIFTMKKTEKDQKKASKKDPDKSANRIWELIEKVLLQGDGLGSNNQDGNHDIVEFGQFSSPLRILEQNHLPLTSLQQWTAVSWHQRMGVAASRKKLFQSDPEHADTAFGLLFHEMAQQITAPVRPQDLLSRELAGKNISKDDHERLLKDLINFVKTGEEQGWFESSKETLLETELLLPNGAILRPDRLIIDGSSVTVVDYKTGTPDPKHEEQVRAYGEVLREMGFELIRLFLIYPGINKLQEVQAA